MADANKRGIFFDGIYLPTFKPLLENPEVRLNAIKNLEGRSDDVLITAFPRSVTHWLWEITHMLLSQEDQYTEKTKETAFLEFVDDWSNIEKIPSPRLLNTHVPYRWLPLQHVAKQRKILHVIRNPKDVFVSLFHFQKNFGYTEDWDSFYKSKVIGSGTNYGGWLEYERTFILESKNVHVIFYEDIKLKPTEEIKRLAKFLDVECSDDLIANIAEKCEFDKLKKAHLTVKKTESKVQHYRKGEIGDWKNHFTVAQNEEFVELFRTKMAGSLLCSKYCPTTS